VIVCIILDVDVHEARVVPHVVVVPIYVPLPSFIYSMGQKVLVRLHSGVPVGLQGRVLVGLQRNPNRSPTSSFLASSFLWSTGESIHGAVRKLEDLKVWEPR
jgi:hypothetical protein